MLNSSIQSQLFTLGSGAIPKANLVASSQRFSIATNQAQRQMAVGVPQMRLNQGTKVISASVMAKPVCTSSSIQMGSSFSNGRSLRTSNPSMSFKQKQTIGSTRAQVKMIVPQSAIIGGAGTAGQSFGAGLTSSSNFKVANPPTIWSSVHQARFSSRYPTQSRSRRSTTAISMGLLDTLTGAAKQFSSGSGDQRYPLLGDESIMSKKAHGTTEMPVQTNLKYGCDSETADRICCFNRHYAEHSGYAFQKPRSWLEEIQENGGQEVTYYDSVTGKPLFVAPRGRTVEQFIQESNQHGWPSFRDEEVVWDNVRCLRNGEAISVDGTHLGHNLPDFKGNRYCINLVSMAGNPVKGQDEVPAKTSNQMKFDGSETVKEMIDGNKVMVFSKSYCPYCVQAKSLLKQGEVDFSVIELDKVPNGQKLQDDLKVLSGQTTVPNIYVTGQQIGGCSELMQEVAEKRFQKLLDEKKIDHKLG